jgi:epoxyqueuosine reductase QueG
MIAKGSEVEIRGLLDGEGIPIVGTAVACELPSVPADFSPESTLTGARSVICYGVPIPKGIVYADSNDLALYWRYCNMVYRSLDMASNKLCLALEQQGHLASPIYSCYPWRVVDREFWGLLPLAYWAEQAGLGGVTKCGLLAHPDHGTRILLGGVVTTMSLEPTEKLGGEPCPSDCFDCIDVCPANAIERTGKVNHGSCAGYANANPLLVHVLADPAVKERFSFETVMNTVGIDDHASYSCFKCLKACPLNNR